MALDQDQQTRYGFSLAALGVFFAVGAEEMFGVVPDALLRDAPKLVAYGTASIVTPITGAVFDRVPDDLELTDHLLHSWGIVLVLIGISALFLLGGIAGETKALLFDLGLVGATIGWAFHVFQDDFL